MFLVIDSKNGVQYARYVRSMRVGGKVRQESRNIGRVLDAERRIFSSRERGVFTFDPATGEFAGQDIETQTRQSLTNIKNILKEAGADMSDVVKTTVLLNDIADFAAMNKVYAEFFTEPYPARAAFQVAAIPKGALVEIEAVAVTD